ncbi:OLC1v1029838C1 [Oldenlandia corymbosa var. corymbosa]|uniref:OLC1v1029838C1 n=1 Tax=Oldenlandia corymbosa var. corymbosa TaxID=529605 RepID=A0AAV1CHR4_OLDCO|nr:OLC1v1029838C1 [Oldenlandia corymbosa var. corymbosa]
MANTDSKYSKGASSSSCSNDSNKKGAVSHVLPYLRYDGFTDLFEVPSKYSPPFDIIGRGSYGIFCSAVDAETGEKVAIKKICSAFDITSNAYRMLKEIKLLQHLDHENIIAIKDLIRPPNRENFRDVYIVYNLMETNLRKVLRSDQELTDDHCQYFVYQMLRGLKYLHSANVLHCDLEPNNIHLNANCDLRIGGFRIARTNSDTEYMTAYGVVTLYRAPELLLHTSSDYSAAIDVWSVGCIFGEMMTRKPLFLSAGLVDHLEVITELLGTPDYASLGYLQSDKARRIVEQLPQNPKPQLRDRFLNKSPLAVDLLEKMLVFDPNQRITGN